MVQEKKKFIYKVDLKWTEARKGVVTSGGKPEIEVATPPEFKGHPGFWTPEDLYVASVNACFMTTFLYYAERRKLAFSAFNTSAEGILEDVAGEFIISTINITAHLLIATGESPEKAKAILEEAEKNCLISNSTKSKVNLSSKIEVVNKGEKNGPS